MKKALAAAALAVGVALGVVAAPQALADTSNKAQPSGKYRLVFHVSENNPVHWNVTLNMAMAFQKNQGKDNSEIEIVAIGPGLNMLKADSKVTGRIAQALERDIDVVACGETMQVTKVKKEDLVGGVRVVPGGLLEIVNRQRSGWSYVRP